MPKVNIDSTGRAGIDIHTGEPVPSQPRRISVGWAKGMHVQVGVGWVDDPQPDAKLPGRRSDDYITSGETDEAGQVWQSQWVDVSRHTINRLIRELRKARDEAFGRDE
jgi:hypothetical protein